MANSAFTPTLFTAAASASGSSGINYLSSHNAADALGTVQVSVGDTLASSTRLSPTAWGCSAATSPLSQSTDSSLRGLTNYLVAFAANGDFVESPLFQLDGSDLGKALKVAFDLTGVGTADDVQAYMVRYNSSNVLQERISLAGTASATAPNGAQLPTGTSSFNSFFVSGSTASDKYALRIRRNATNTSLRLDSFSIGPQSIGVGFAGQDWQSYTPTFTGITATGTVYYRRVGDSIEVQGFVDATAANASTFKISLPTGLNIDSTKISATQKNRIGIMVISGGAQAASFSSSVGLNLVYDSADANSVFAVNQNNTDATGFVFEASRAGNTLFNATTQGAFTFSAPIVGWSSSITMADRAVEEYAFNTSTSSADDSTSFGYGPAGTQGIFGTTTLAAARKKRVRFTTPIQPTDTIIIEVKSSTSDYWAPVGQGAGTSGSKVVQHHTENAQDYGMAWTPVNSTDVDVYFGRYPNNDSATFGGNASEWSNGAFANYKWRVRKVSGGAMVGYPVGSQNLVGRTDGVAPSAGYVGERISSATSLSVSSGANTTITSITLTPGVWDVCFAAASAGLASATEFDAGIATATNSQTGWVFGDTYASCLMSGGTANVSVSIPGWRTNITSTTTYYLTCNRAGGTSATAFGRITAVRVA